MPEQEQALADDYVATLHRWWVTQGVLADVAAERQVQYEQWGDQDIPMGSHPDFKMLEDYHRTLCQRKTRDGDVTYSDVLLEEVYEALAETDPGKMYDELVQVAAVAVKMAELIKRKLPITTAIAQG